MSYDEQRYSQLIYDILRESDLNTVSAKRIRNALSERLGHDVSEHKAAINHLIEVCFDRVNAENANGTNGASASPSPSDLPSSSPQKRKEPSDESDLSDVADEKPKKKRVKIEKSAQEDDAAYAARLQAELNNLGRPTRSGGASRKKATSRKKKTPAKVKDNSDGESPNGAEPKERKGGFHKPMNLSEPLSTLLGETQLSRPQTVKKIWEYVKSKDLQDPSDKRQIVCDEPMRAVFKTDRVHMFTMNKLLNQNLYAVDE